MSAHKPRRASPLRPLRLPVHRAPMRAALLPGASVSTPGHCSRPANYTQRECRITCPFALFCAYSKSPWAHETHLALQAQSRQPAMPDQRGGAAAHTAALYRHTHMVQIASWGDFTTHTGAGAAFHRVLTCACIEPSSMMHTSANMPCMQ